MCANLFQSFSYEAPVFIAYQQASTNTPDDSTSGMMLYCKISDAWEYRIAFTSNHNIYTCITYNGVAPAWHKI